MSEHRDSEHRARGHFADSDGARLDEESVVDDLPARALPVEADEADVLEQATAVPGSDEDEYRD